MAHTPCLPERAAGHWSSSHRQLEANNSNAFQDGEMTLMVLRQQKGKMCDCGKKDNKVRDTAQGKGCKVSKANGEWTFPPQMKVSTSPRESGQPREVIALYEDEDIPFQGTETRGLSHEPTFQRCGDAAHFIEARIPLTADHLQKEAGRRAGKEPNETENPLRGRESNLWELYREEERAHSCSLQGEQKLLISQCPEGEKQCRCKCLANWALQGR